MVGEKCNYDVIASVSVSNTSSAMATTHTTLIALDTPVTSNDDTPSDPEEICYIRVNSKVGLLFASKFLVRIATSPFAGFLTVRCGYFALLFVGGVLMVISSLGESKFVTIPPRLLPPGPPPPNCRSLVNVPIVHCDLEDRVYPR